MDIVKMAKQLGFDDAAVIDVKEIRFESEFRMYCEQNLCGKYGANYTCPPHCGSEREMRQKVLQHANALVLRSLHQGVKYSDNAAVRGAQVKHNNDMLTLVKELKAIGTKSALFVADLIEKFLWRCLHLFGDDSEVCIHDYAAAAPLIDPATVTETKREVCHVDFYGGMSDGMLVVDRRQAPNEKNPVEVVYHMDGERTHKLLSDLLKKY